jgi:predicted Zn-dependent protease
MAILTRDEARAILEKVLKLSKADGCEVNLGGSVGGNLRFARNTVTTSGAVETTSLAVQSNLGKKSGTATINEFDDASLEKVVRRSEELAKLAPENPEFVEFLEPQQYLQPKAYFESTATIRPETRAEAARTSIEPAQAKDITVAGFYEDSAFFQSKLNSKGLYAYHSGTDVNFSLTARTNDGTGSGYAARNHNDVGKIDASRVSSIAIDKAVLSKNPKAIEPGKYTVILEPAASVGLLQFMFFGMDARQADEGRSYMSKPGGGTKLGEKLVDERVTIYSDPTHPELPASPYSGDGRPQEKTFWIEKGVVKNLYYSRYWAQKQGVKGVPFPNGGIFEGGDMSLEAMIQDTKKGVLVTRTWYIRMVDPQTVLLTGLTRDGTYYVEDGKIQFPIKNFRFNESPIIMLNNLEALGKPERIGAGGDNFAGALIPPMKIRDFTFSSLSDAV